jgi:AGCS family alanine or glycine:cation symporter
MRCAEFLFGHNIIRPYEYIWCIVIVIGSVTNLKLVWDITDTLNGLMAIPNLIALLALSPIIIKLSKHYFEVVKKAEHIETLKHDELLKQ